MALGAYILIGAAVAALIVWRVVRLSKPSNKPVTSRRLIVLLVLVPGLIVADWALEARYLHYSPAWLGVAAAAVGLVFSLLLIVTTEYEIRADGQIYSKPNGLFVLSFVGLIVIRLLATILLATHVSTGTFGFLDYVVFLAYFVPWRLACLIKFRRIASQGDNLKPS